MNWFLFWLVLHIAAAVVGFGPVFAFPFVATLGERHPAHLAFAAEVTDVIARRLVMPLGGTMLISGLALVYTAKINLVTTPYLLISLLLYLVLMGVAGMHQLPVGARVLALTAAAAGGAQTGPPSGELASLLTRLRIVGMVLTGLLLVILVLMVVQPGGITYR